MAADLAQVVPALVEARIEFILVGGMAAILHGSARVTYDIDIVYKRDGGNLQRLAALLQPFDPYLRGAPPGLPFTLDERTLRQGLNFTLTTRLGDLDLFGEIIGGGTYDELLSRTVAISAFGVEFRCVDLPTLIKLKQAAGRPRDLEALAELNALAQENG